jgi:hypothetical protein
MERKAFDQVLHDENDAIAKEAVRSFLEAVWGYPVTEGGQYDVDLLIYEEDTICGYVEVERRHNWDKQHFPFDTLNIPERKRKFFTLDQPSLLFAVSKDCKWAVFVPGEIVLQCPVKMLDNKFCFQEPFFVVPIEYCMLVDLEKKPDGVKTPPGQPCDSGGED